LSVMGQLSHFSRTCNSRMRRLMLPDQQRTEPMRRAKVNVSISHGGLKERNEW
jgi:hypothetical protein